MSRDYVTHLGAAVVVFVSCMTAPAVVSAQAAAAASLPPAEEPLRFRLDAVSLGEALKRIAAILPIRLVAEPGLELRPVSVDLEGLDVRTALVRVLDEAGVDYIVVGLWRDDGQPVQVNVRSPRRAAPLSANAGGRKTPGVELNDDARGARILQPGQSPRSAKDARSDPEAAEQPAISEGLETMPPSPDSIPLVRSAPGVSNGSRTSGAGLAILPFPDKNGNPIPIVSAPAPAGGGPSSRPGMRILPFPDPNGNPIPIPPPPKGPDS